MLETKISGFFSYAHDDNDMGVLEELQEDLRKEYAALTARELDLYFDRDSLNWGDRWEESISRGVDSSSFFIPVLTPRYFRSEYCLKELSQYLSKAEAQNARQLILPIHFIDVSSPSLAIDHELVKRVLGYQYTDWRDLRFEDRGSSKRRRMINEMANRLIEADEELAEMASAPMPKSPGPAGEEEGDEGEARPDAEEGGREAAYYLEDSLELQPTSEEFGLILNDLSGNILEMQGIFTNGSDELKKLSSNPKAMLAATQKLAHDLTPVADDYMTNSKRLSEKAADMDHHVRGLIPLWKSLPGDGGENKNKNKNKNKNQNLAAIGDLCDKAATARGQVSSFLDAFSSVENISRSLAKPVKTIQAATVGCLSSFDIIIAWGELV